MPCGNRIILAAAGSGKTTTIVSEAVASKQSSALVTYTNNAVQELRKKCYETTGYVPPQVRPITWFTFLLRHFVRPYQRALLDGRVTGLSFVSGTSTRFVRSDDVRKYNTDRRGRIYSDKISRFACQVIDKTDGIPLRRAEKIFDRIYIDEMQDMSGYDLDFIELLMGSNIDIVLVGDHRQATYRTNQARRHRQYSGANVFDKLREWENSGLASMEIQNFSYRCIKPICEFADRFFPDAPTTISRNPTESDHDGIFLVRERDVAAYTREFAPQRLRFDRKTTVDVDPVYNFGEAKGMTFHRVLIHPHASLRKYLQTGSLEDAGKALSKIYVGVTRARQSVAFVVPNSFKNCPIPGVSWFKSASCLTDKAVGRPPSG